MNYKFIQTHSGLSALYEARINDYITYTAEIPHNFIGAKSNFIKNNILLYSLNFDWIEDVKSVLKPSKTRNIRPFNICNVEGPIIGSLSKKRTKAFWGYCYYLLTLNEKVYRIYQVGCGKQGIKIPIYSEDDKQIALIEKETVVYDNKDIYEITAIDEASAEIATLFNLYYDYDQYARQGEFVIKSKNISYSYSLHKEEKAKYNPEFKSNVMKNG